MSNTNKLKEADYFSSAKEAEREGAVPYTKKKPRHLPPV